MSASQNLGLGASPRRDAWADRRSFLAGGPWVLSPAGRSASSSGQPRGGPQGFHPNRCSIWG